MISLIVSWLKRKLKEGKDVDELCMRKTDISIRK